ncbi:MAG: hypothetical protein AAF725_13050 [Acidobacteriota bacterium]
MRKRTSASRIGFFLSLSLAAAAAHAAAAGHHDLPAGPSLRLDQGGALSFEADAGQDLSATALRLDQDGALSFEASAGQDLSAPALRLDQDGGSAFATLSWDVGNAARLGR